MEKYQMMSSKLDKNLVYKLQHQGQFPPSDQQIQEEFINNNSILDYHDGCKMLDLMDQVLEEIEDAVLNPHHVKMMLKEEIVKNLYENTMDETN